MLDFNIKDIIKLSNEYNEKLTPEGLYILNRSLPHLDGNDEFNLGLLVSTMNTNHKMFTLYPHLTRDKLFVNMLLEELYFFIGKLSNATKEKLVDNIQEMASQFYQHLPIKENKSEDRFEDRFFDKFEELDES